MFNDLQISGRRARQIGTEIQGSVDELVSLWELYSRREQPEADEVRRQQLRNSLPQFLAAFGAGLADAGDSSPLSNRFAIDHGIQRWELGWSIVELLRDFNILRRCVLLRLRQRLELTADEAELLAATFDEAAANSVQTYADHREAELVQTNEELTQSVFELRRFAHVIAHEIRAPLSTIQMATEAIAAEQSDTNAEELKMIRDSARYMRAVVNDTLAYAKIGAVNERKQTVDLNIVFEDALAHLAYRIRRRGAELSAPDLPTIPGYQSLLVQLFVNLIENGIRYSTGKPRIRIACEQRPGRVRLVFRDDGIGIPQEHHESIFRFLMRIDSSSNGGPASGIGLAICRRVAEEHGGQIWVESVPGEGSAFFVELATDDHDVSTTA